MNNITLKQLRYFSVLKDYGQFGLAADVCSISQPAMSVQIKDLEMKLGKVLFERYPRGVELTEFGLLFSNQVEKTLMAFNDLVDVARSVDDQFSGEYRLGIARSIAPYFLTQVIKTLASSYKDLKLQVLEDSTDSIIKDLMDGKLDIAIVALPISEPSLKEVVLFTEDFVLVRPYEDDEKPIPTTADLGSLPLLLLKDCHFFRNRALSFWGTMAHKSFEKIDGSSLSTLVQMVSKNLGTTLIPEMAVAIETKSVKVSVSRFTAPKPSRTIGIVWRKSSPMANEFMQIADVLKTQPDG